MISEYPSDIYLLYYQAMSLLKESSKLTHKSLESFILETLESENAPYAYEFEEHPNFSTVSKEIK